jgi:hypothetical protein
MDRSFIHPNPQDTVGELDPSNIIIIKSGLPVNQHACSKRTFATKSDLIDDDDDERTGIPPLSTTRYGSDNTTLLLPSLKGPRANALIQQLQSQLSVALMKILPLLPAPASRSGEVLQWTSGYSRSLALIRQSQTGGMASTAWILATCALVRLPRITGSGGSSLVGKLGCR